MVPCEDRSGARASFVVGWAEPTNRARRALDDKLSDSHHLGKRSGTGPSDGPIFGKNQITADGMTDVVFLSRLAFEANNVIALRMMKLMLGSKRAARREARLMVSEKVDAAFKASRSLIGGASAEEIVGQYRKRVAANAKRLSKVGSGHKAKKIRRGRR